MARSSTRVYSCEFWEIFITSFFTELLRWLFLEASYHKCYAQLLVLGEGPLVKFQANSFIKKLLCVWCFPLNFAKVFRTVFLKNTSNWMLLNRLVMVCNLLYDWLLIIIVLCRFIAENFTTAFLYQYVQTRGIFRTLSNIYGGLFTKTANGF